MVTPHRTIHLLAVINDAQDLPPGTERGRIISEAAEILDEIVPWPDERLEESDIADWIEDVDSRTSLSTRGMR